MGRDWGCGQCWSVRAYEQMDGNLWCLLFGCGVGRGWEKGRKMRAKYHGVFKYVVCLWGSRLQMRE